MRLRIPMAAAAALVVVAGCGATALRRTNALEPTLTQSIDAQIARDDGIVWSARRSLTWADFKAKPPDDVSIVAAHTRYTIVHGMRCAGSKFEYRVVAAFRPNESWVRHAVLRTPADSARALRHEQTHFDLSEVHARRLRRYFAELMAPCNMSSDDLASAATRMERAEKAAQALYDDETQNSRNAAQQARWDKEIQSQLTALAKFVR